MLTRRENYLRILRKQKGEFLPFAPNFDHWLNVNTVQNTLPAEFRGMSRNDIVRAVRGTIWARTGALRTVVDPSVQVKQREDGDRILTEFITPVGKVDTLHRRASDFTRALFLKEHRIKSVEDIAVVKYVIQHTAYELDAGPFLQSEREVGNDGISLVGLPGCLPYIAFGKTEAGWERGIYLYHDNRSEVEELLQAMARSNEQAARLLARSPVSVIASDDNMDEWTTPPRVFREHAIPYYRRMSEILHAAGKTFEVHWCGRTQHLLEYVPECGIDVVEAVTVKPMAELTIPEALAKVGDGVVIQGGIPSALLCPQGGTRDHFRRYVAQLLTQVPHGCRFVLGMSDNVPPDADFERVKMAGELCEQMGRQV